MLAMVIVFGTPGSLLTCSVIGIIYPGLSELLGLLAATIAASVLILLGTLRITHFVALAFLGVFAFFWVIGEMRSLPVVFMAYGALMGPVVLGHIGRALYLAVTKSASPGDYTQEQKVRLGERSAPPRA